MVGILEIGDVKLVPAQLSLDHIFTKAELLLAVNSMIDRIGTYYRSKESPDCIVIFIRQRFSNQAGDARRSQAFHGFIDLAFYNC